MTDTRAKIVSAGSALHKVEGRTVVTGYFDPMAPAHVRRLAEIAGESGNLVVLVLSPSEPLLELRARAELVAALRMVDWVVPCESALPVELLAAAGRVVRDEEGDLARAAELMEHVRRRQSAG